jgi:aldose 1-epimerase
VSAPTTCPAGQYWTGTASTRWFTAARGQPLIPWPNRLHGGTYIWDGARHTVPLDEPEQGNALHGLCRYRNWTAERHDEASVTIRLRRHPSPPYRFTLDLAAHYRLHEDGLHVQTAATNIGDTHAPTPKALTRT